MFLENAVSGANMSGIQYHWDTWESFQWYYGKAVSASRRGLGKRTINNWLTIRSFVSPGYHATGAFVVETS